jgi:hypothetical protein
MAGQAPLSPPAGVIRKRLRVSRKRKVLAVAIVLLIAYSALYVSGRYYQVYLYSSQQKLGSQAITFRGPYPSPTNSMSNLTLRDSNGNVLFSLVFRLYWPSPNYTGSLIFVTMVALCPYKSVSIHSLDVWYEQFGTSYPNLYVDPLSFTSWPGVSVQTHSFGPWFGISYDYPQTGYPNQCGEQLVSFETVGDFTYAYTISVDATLYNMNPTATPFIGQTYSATATIAILVSANGTATLGQATTLRAS